ncbi:uncharacterized protein LOC119682427 [Teleopsis dalmanni]|uniref:uncharacterized protein LOC119682427 n=1 Tax=Teleopsis dalmanni TaxID=139649 RepID=UPI0018CF570F|nr:uncharacterized protein LOC119682427 [Teleopsis dalmanni]
MANEFTHFQQMQNLCLQELNQLQTNLNNTVEATKMLLNSFNENKYNYNEYCEESLTIYDKCVTTITEIMNASRKANVKFKLKLSEVREYIQYYYKRDAHCREKAVVASKLKAIAFHSHETVKANAINIETETIDNNTNNNIGSPYLCVDKKMYMEGSIIAGYISHIENLEDLSFYIMDPGSTDVPLLEELAKKRDLIKYKTQPSYNVIFGLEIDNVMIRAIFTKLDSLNTSNYRKALLLDYGDKVDITESTVFYQLDEKYKAVPAQAIFSKLCSEKKNYIELQKKIENLVTNIVHFRVKCIENDILYLYFYDCITSSNGPVTPNRFGHMQISKATVTTNGWRTVPEENNQYDDMSSYFKEPTTTNALKAIMGYIPKDDIKLCEFYDPKTGGCFKGKHCTKEHKPKPVNGTTKDMQITSNVINYNEKRFLKNAVICVQPTYITRLDQMYCTIVSDKPNDTHIWTDKEIWRPLNKLPHLHDMVLARYDDDGYWYRGKVVDEDALQNVVKVFYVDYGNTETVTLENLSACESSIARLPYRAILCKMAHVTDITETEEERADGLHLLKNKILNHNLDAEVVVDYEDIVIKFLDDDIIELFETLKKMNYVTNCA